MQCSAGTIGGDRRSASCSRSALYLEVTLTEFTWAQATPSWFVRVTAFKDRLLANNKMTQWVPPDVRDRRFHNWLEVCLSQALMCCQRS